MRAEKVDDIYGNNRWQKTKEAIGGKKTIGTIDNKKTTGAKLMGFNLLLKFGVIQIVTTDKKQ